MPRLRVLGRSVVTTHPRLDEDGHPHDRIPEGPERARRHPHRRARSAPPCGVSRSPRGYQVRVPIRIDRRRGAGRTHLIASVSCS